MNIWRIHPDKPDSKIIENAVNFLRTGEIIAHATETVYGLAVVYRDAVAIERLSELKQRPPDQPYSLLVSEIWQIIELIGWETPALRKLLTGLFPAPVTVLLPRKRRLTPDFWNQFDTLGFRLPDHPLSHALVKGVGEPIITTSANVAKAPPPVAAMDISWEILQGIACLLDSGICPLKIPSTVIHVDLTNRRYQVVREGAYPVAEIEAIFSKL